MNDNAPDAATTADHEEARAEQFSKVADLARKAMDDHIANLGANTNAPLLDAYNKSMAILLGTATAVTTCMVGLTDSVAMPGGDQAAVLHSIVGQMANTFNEIQERKALLSATEGGTRQ